MRRIRKEAKKSDVYVDSNNGLVKKKEKRKDSAIWKVKNKRRSGEEEMLCHFGSFNQNASIRNISTCSPIPVVNDARKYDGIRLCSSFMWIIIISSSSSHYISKGHKDYW
ncbi:hypothetical protein J1N35_010837 [Gossypium stocksii]|uniref:Uncharacterized protein n=1 Tax=Gossypium stocksii TaxID=47602 RepID=A0A9D4ACF0_9ROSI|nr:hypothetical protein J1N35_010837 [Gossypium stocksii]